jgi:hypothetical protein
MNSFRCERALTVRLRRDAKTTRLGKAEGRRAQRVKRVGVGPHAH